MLKRMFVNTKFKTIPFFYKTPSIMARAMFEYTKTILKKVSFDSELFCKELEKAIERLLPYELKELKIWVEAFIENKPNLYACVGIV